jgi:hypothetical protein
MSRLKNKISDYLSGMITDSELERHFWHVEWSEYVNLVSKPSELELREIKDLFYVFEDYSPFFPNVIDNPKNEISKKSFDNLLDVWFKTGEVDYDKSI